MQPLNRHLAVFENEKIWVNWKYEVKDGKPTKVPYSAMITGRAASDNPDTWARYASLNHDMGIGIMFPLDRTVLGIDIDHCLLKDTNTIDHIEKETIVNFLIEADTYTEISPSKTGLHLWFRLSDPFVPEVKKHAPYEMYTSGRYFTVTNFPYKEAKPIRTISSKEAIELLKIIGYPWNEPAKTSLPSSGTTEDDVLLAKMFASKNGAQIKALYDGDKSQYKDDWSSADMALCTHLAFWTGGNAVQIDRLWLKSALSNRDKAVTRKDYRPRTIAKAIRGCKEFYTGSQNSQESNKPKSTDALVFIKSSDIVSRPIDWLWPGKIARGKLSIIAGDPGLGKSQSTIDIASIVSNGSKWPSGENARQGNVLFFSAEDDPEDTINPRLLAAGANTERVSIFSTVKKGGKEKYFSLGEDIDLLEKTLETEKNIALIVIDPITAFLGEKIDSHVNAEVRGLLSRLSKVANKSKTAVLVVTHLNKSTGGNPINKITGSLAFAAAARAVYMVIKDEQDDQRRLFLTVKNNLAEDKSGYAFKVEGAEITTPTCTLSTSKVVWEKEAISQSALEALRDQSDRGSGVDKKTIKWLEEYLKSKPEGIQTEDLVRVAVKNGISKRTLQRALKEAMVESISSGYGKQKVWKYASFEDEVPI